MKFALTLAAFVAAINAVETDAEMGPISHLMMNEERSIPESRTGLTPPQRGPMRTPHRKAKQVGQDEDRKIPTISFNERPSGPFYDWRDWAPDSDMDPYDVCDFPETDHFDTKDYQALPAMCKHEMIWKKVL